MKTFEFSPRFSDDHPIKIYFSIGLRWTYFKAKFKQFKINWLKIKLNQFFEKVIIEDIWKILMWKKRFERRVDKLKSKICFYQKTVNNSWNLNKNIWYSFIHLHKSIAQFIVAFLKWVSLWLVKWKGKIEKLGMNNFYCN